MTGICETCEAQLEYERSDDYPGVLEWISDRWRVIVGNLSGDRFIELQQFIDGEWFTFIAERAEGIIDLPENFGMSRETPNREKGGIIGVNMMNGPAKH